MSKGETLRALMTERLTAAAEEIFALVEKTIAEYEEELCRSKEENQRRQELLEEALSPKVRAQTTDVQTQTQTESRQQLLEEALSTDVQIQTESPIKPLPVKQEDEGSPDVTRVIVKSENNDSDVEERGEFPASDRQTESEADVVEVFEENSDVLASTCWMETEFLREDHGSDLRLHQDAVPQNASPQTSALQYTALGTAEPQTAEPETAEPQTNMSSVDMAVKAEKLPGGKRKRRKPKRLIAAADEEEPLPKQTNEKRAGSKSVKRGRTEAEAHPTDSPPETPRRDAARKRDSEHSPGKSKCAKSAGKSASSLESVAQSPAFAGVKGGSPEFRCSYCDRVFTRLHHLERHVLIHTGERSFCCSVCDKSFRLKQHLISHMTIHKEERLFSCPVCPQKFKRKDNLGRHIMVHTGIKAYGCSQCDVRFSLKKNLMRHMIVHDRDVIYSCSICTMKFSSPFYYQRHTKTHMKRKYFQIKTERQDEAGACLDGLWSAAGVTEREERLPDFTAVGAMSNEQTERRGDTDCEDWSYDWQPQPGSSRPPLDTDDEDYNPENEPPFTELAGRKASAKGGKAGSDAEGKVKHECPVCLKKLGRKQELKRHMLLHTGEKPFSCPVCDKRFIQKSNLKSHIVTHMDSVDTIIRFQKPMEASRGEGDDWGDLGSSPRDKLTDNLSDSDDDDWAGMMTEPGASGSSRQAEAGDDDDDDDQDAGSLERISLLLHQALNESKARGKTTEFQCPMCDKIFGRMENLRRHLLVHTGEKAFSCPVCSKQFTLKQHLKLHMVLHTRDQQFACSVCAKTFIRKDNLRSHMRIHSTDRPFGCSQCGARFYTDQDLARHTAHHTGERPFVCPVCNSGFLSRRYLNRHVKIHKREEEKAGKSKEQSVDGLN